jgi:hypothetical protein
MIVAVSRPDDSPEMLCVAVEVAHLHDHAARRGRLEVQLTLLGAQLGGHAAGLVHLLEHFVGRRCGKCAHVDVIRGSIERRAEVRACGRGGARLGRTAVRSANRRDVEVHGSSWSLCCRPVPESVAPASQPGHVVVFDALGGNLRALRPTARGLGTWPMWSRERMI